MAVTPALFSHSRFWSQSNCVLARGVGDQAPPGPGRDRKATRGSWNDHEMRLLSIRGSERDAPTGTRRVHVAQ
jgi:hypothetical protein